MFDEAVKNHSDILRFFYDYYKIQKVCNKTVSTYSPAIQFESYKSQTIRDKAISTCPFVFDFILDQYMTQKMPD